MALTNLTNGHWATAGTSGDSANISFSAGDVIIVSLTQWAFTNSYSVTHPDLTFSSPAAVAGASSTEFMVSWWAKAAGSSSGSPVTFSNAPGLGNAPFTINLLPVADTSGTLVQAVDTLQQPGINGGSSPQTFTAPYTTTPLSTSILVAVWGDVDTPVGDSIGPRVSPAWTEVDEKNFDFSGTGASIEIQTFAGLDTESQAVFTVEGGGTGAPKVLSVIYEFAGPSTGTTVTNLHTSRRAFRRAMRRSMH